MGGSAIELEQPAVSTSWANDFWLSMYWHSSHSIIGSIEPGTQMTDPANGLTKWGDLVALAIVVSTIATNSVSNRIVKGIIPFHANMGHTAGDSIRRPDEIQRRLIIFDHLVIWNANVCQIDEMLG